MAKHQFKAGQIVKNIHVDWIAKVAKVSSDCLFLYSKGMLAEHAMPYTNLKDFQIVE